mmetsp:Transcript_14753/g.46306  ORF Transcript_14753/g.46306 Transcript_14753/m.46306 type:complete len:327 (-) Transcript_14753:232-1212(-)
MPGSGSATVVGLTETPDYSGESSFRYSVRLSLLFVRSILLQIGGIMYWVGIWNALDLYCWPGDDTTLRDTIYSIVGAILVATVEVWQITSGRAARATSAADADDRFQELLEDVRETVDDGETLAAVAVASLAAEEAMSLRPRYEREIGSAEDYSLLDEAEDSITGPQHQPGMRFARPGNLRPPDDLFPLPSEAEPVMPSHQLATDTPPRPCCALSPQRKSLFVELGKGLLPDLLSILMMTGFWNILDFSLPWGPSLQRELGYAAVGFVVFAFAFLVLDDHICLPPRDTSLMERRSERVGLPVHTLPAHDPMMLSFSRATQGGANVN